MPSPPVRPHPPFRPARRSRPARFRPANAAILAGCFALAITCGPDGEESRVQRWIEEDAEVLLAPASYLDEAVVFHWRLREDDVAPFALDGPEAGSPRRVQGGLELPSTTPPTRLVREVELEAASVDAIEVRFAAPPRGRLRLSWTGRGEDRPVRHALVREADGAQRVVRFRTTDAQGWTGKISRIELARGSGPQPAGVVQSIRGLRHRVDSDALAVAVARPWKVDLGNDVRNALLAPPGLPLRRTVRVPEGGSLELAYGVWPRASSPLGFRVLAAVGDEDPVPLLEERLEAGAEEAWTDASIDLADHEGESVTLTLETIADGEPDLGRGMPVWAHPEVVAAPTRSDRPNVVLLSIDTLRADHMSGYGYPRPTTPRLDAWVESSGIRFETVVAPSPWTLPSHVSMLTGLDAVTHGVNYRAPAVPSLETVAEVFRREGYATLAFTAGGFLSPEFGLTQGFDVYRLRQKPPGPQKRDNLENELDDAREWVRRVGSRPFFLFFHTYEVHDPYWARQPYFERFAGRPPDGEDDRVWFKGSGERPEDGFAPRRVVVLPSGEGKEASSLAQEEIDLMVAAYDSGIAFMDDQVGRFLEELSAMELPGGTIVALTSDHGEMLGEHDLLAHSYLYDENLLVPLLLSVPEGRAAGRVVPDQVRLVDVMPTLLELAGLPVPERIDGRSLVPFLAADEEKAEQREERPAWSYAAWSNRGLALRVDNRLKYVLRNAVWPPVQGGEEIYDLRRDPGEAENLAAPDRMEPWRSRAREYLESRLSGLRVAFRNEGSAALTGSLSGAMVSTRGITSGELPCECIRWGGDGTVRFEVPPGEGYTVFFELAGGDPVRLVGRLAGADAAGSFDTRLDLGKADLPFQIAHLDGEWVESAIDAAAGTSLPAVGLRLWWGREPAGGEEVPIQDEALRRELEDLGYIQ